MQILKANTAGLADKHHDQSHGLIAKSTSHELLATSVLTVMGTAALVGIHHRYRKQQHPDASLQDYVTGIRAHFYKGQAANGVTPQLTRFRYACRQAAVTWWQAYHQAIDNNGDLGDNF